MQIGLKLIPRYDYITLFLFLLERVLRKEQGELTQKGGWAYVKGPLSYT